MLQKARGSGVDAGRNDLGTVNGHHPYQVRQGAGRPEDGEGIAPGAWSGAIDGPSARQVGVKTRAAARLAWSLCAGCIAGICGLVVLKALNGGTDLWSMPLVAAPLAFSVVGALVASRQRRNPVGWQLLAVGVFMTANLAGESYARYALLTAPGSLPGGLYGAWLGWSYAPIVAILAVFLPLYFPTGRLLSPRWRPVLWLGAGFLVLAVAGNALWPGPDVLVPGVDPVRNPVVFLPRAKPLFELLQGLAGLCLLPAIGGAIAALVVRFRRSRGVERQQLKWFTYAAALAPLPPSPTTSIPASSSCCAQ